MTFPQMAMRFVKYLLIITLILVGVVGSIGAYTYYSIPKIQTPVSILVLGTGGEGHTAPDLTDTLMQVTLNNNKVSVLSLPRDIWVPEMRAKLNTAYHYGGFKMADDSVSSITGVPVNYNVLLDFSVFKDLIDSMSGISVNVENSFVDEKYPIAGKENDLCGGDKTYKCRYETLDIKSGTQIMNGEMALKFVRSRNAKGDEGTDIAREKRQQKVIEGIKEKLSSPDVLLSYSTLKRLFEVVTSHLKTDINKDVLMSLSKYVIESKVNINYLTIPEDMLIVSQNNKKYDNQYVFIPKTGNWLVFQSWVKESL